MQGAQKLRSEAHLQVRRNNEVAVQRRRWTFYETICIYCSLTTMVPEIRSCQARLPEVNPIQMKPRKAGMAEMR